MNETKKMIEKRKIWRLFKSVQEFINYFWYAKKIGIFRTIEVILCLLWFYKPMVSVSHPQKWGKIWNFIEEQCLHDIKELLLFDYTLF